LLALVALVPNLNSFGAFFVGDDFDFLSRMMRLSGAADTLTMSYWGEWEPLWYLGFYRDFKLWGLDPAGYHAANLFWLVLGVVVLYRIVADLWPEAILAPWAAALLFATHPLHDEAVTYLAARGHPMAAALALLALWFYLRARSGAWGGRLGWGAAALLAALAAATAKETALVLPVWVGVLEWSVFGRLRIDFRTALRSMGSALLFVVPGLVYLGLRHLAVGLGSDKLRGPDDGVLELLESVVNYLPKYALAGGLPLPFAFVDLETISAFEALGWGIAVVVVLPALLLVARRMWKCGEVSLPLGLYVFGLIIVLVSLLPVFWADLGLRRRYFYTSSIGSVLAAAIVFEWLAARRPRVAWVLVLALTVCGGWGVFYRNDLYRQAGEVTQGFIETVGGIDLDRAVVSRTRVERRVSLTTLPRYLGGDGFSGAYVLHRSDARSALRIAGADPELAYALQCHYADDYSVVVEHEEPEALDLTISFQAPSAYEAASWRDPAGDRLGNLVGGRLVAQDDAARVLHYKLQLAPGYFDDPRNELYLYSDGGFHRLKKKGDRRAVAP
jgi:hypothetical protein